MSPPESSQRPNRFLTQIYRPSVGPASRALAALATVLASTPPTVRRGRQGTRLPAVERTVKKETAAEAAAP